MDWRRIMGAQDGFAAIREQLSLWISVSRGRSQLARMDDRMLADIGVTREQAMVEAKRPFWDTTHRVDMPVCRPQPRLVWNAG
ncbi:MAG: DUF1127 domain-containing protein [Pseudomonadota bacterium]